MNKEITLTEERLCAFCGEPTFVSYHGWELTKKISDQPKKPILHDTCKPFYLLYEKLK